MVYFDLASILSGIPISFIVGILTSLLISFERILISIIPFSICSFKGKNDGGGIREYLKSASSLELSSPVTCFIGVITVFISFILMSYILLFGQIRIYILLVMLSGFFISERFISRYIELLVKIVVSFIAFLVLRICLTIVKILLIVFKKVEFSGKVEKTIDNRAEIL